MSKDFIYIVLFHVSAKKSNMLQATFSKTESMYTPKTNLFSYNAVQQYGNNVNFLEN